MSIKLETANPVRSFKARGTEVVASLLAGNASSRAVVCASAGNLGQALAWSGRGRGLDVTVVASRFATRAKLDRIRALDAGLELVDGDHEMARERAAAIARHDGIRLVEDSLDIETCEGAAAIGLKLVDTAFSFDMVLIALGGGALATGVGHVMKALAPEVEVICVQPLGALALTHSWRRRRVVTTDSTDTIADGVAGRRPIPAVWTPSSWLLTTPSWFRRHRSPPVCGCSLTMAASSANLRPRSASRRSSKTVTASPTRRHHRVRQQRRRRRLPPLGRRSSHPQVLTSCFVCHRRPRTGSAGTKPG